MNEFFAYAYEQAKRIKGLATIITLSPKGDLRIQVNWKDACKRGGDMIIAYAEEPDTREAFREALERLKKWINEHEEKINERIRYM